MSTHKRLEKLPYDRLNARQKENYNFHKVSAVLAEYGFTTMRLTADWQGADFIAQHADGQTFLKIQLKGRLTFDGKYRGKDLYIAFPHGRSWYLYPHDAFLDQVLAEFRMGNTSSWKKNEVYSFARVSRTMEKALEPYKLWE